MTYKEEQKDNAIEIQIQSLSSIAIFLEGMKAGKGGDILPLGTNDLTALWDAIKYLRGNPSYKASRLETRLKFDNDIPETAPSFGAKQIFNAGPYIQDNSVNEAFNRFVDLNDVHSSTKGVSEERDLHKAYKEIYKRREDEPNPSQ